MSPLTFAKVAVAIAFTERLEALVVTARKFQQIFGSEILFIHVGEPSEQKRNRLEALMKRHQFSYDQVFWEKGRILDRILDFCQEQDVDLLLCGSKPKVNVFQYYIGTLGCDLLRKADCSVMIMVKESEEEAQLKRIAVNLDENNHSDDLLELGLEIAHYENVEEIYVTKESATDYFQMVTSDVLSYHENAQLKRQIIRSENNQIEKQLTSHQDPTVKVKTHLLFGKPGIELRNFAVQKSLDILIARAPEVHYGFIDRVFQHNIEFLLEDIPCSLLMVRY